MLYHLFDFLEANYGLPGAGVFQFITFRAAMSVIVALIISLLFGRRILNILLKKQVGETVRELGLAGEEQKQGTPTMGGIMILASILIPALLFCDLTNIYILLLIVSTVWLGLIGFLDDYIKVFKKDKGGLKGRFKVFGQVGLGLLVGAVMYFHPDIVLREQINHPQVEEVAYEVSRDARSTLDGETYHTVDIKAPLTTIPFFKSHEFNYGSVLSWMSKSLDKWAWLIYIPFVIFLITAVSNGANLTDGLDGLAAGVSAIIMLALGIFAYLSGSFMLSDYLNIMYIPESAEIVIFASAFVGACLAFLWWNAYPAQVFMGDTGSLALGGIIGALAIIIRKEFLIPILCGVFLLESLSVIIQVTYFKYTKKKYGEGKRVFLMSPIHHHYQKKGIHEAKIVSRFWITGLFLAVITFITFKLR